MNKKDPEYKRRIEAADSLPKREFKDILRDMLHARMYTIHPGLLPAQYGLDDFDQAELALELQAQGWDSRDRVMLGKRQQAFLELYRSNQADWRSDRIYGAVELIVKILQDHREEAAKLQGRARYEYLATHKVLVFCEFLAGLDLIAIGLERERIKFLRFDGNLGHGERDQARRLFEEEGKDYELPDTRPDEHLVMLVTNRTGHEGLTLVHGTDTILMSPNWNPYTEKQIEGREARKGQVNTVTIHRLFGKGCIEDKIHFTMKSKRAVVL